MENSFLDLIFQEDGSLQFLAELLVMNLRAVFLLACCLLVLRIVRMSASTRHIILATALISIALLPFYTKISPSVDIVLETSNKNPSLVDKSLISFFQLADIFSIEEEMSANSEIYASGVNGPDLSHSQTYVVNNTSKSINNLDWTLILSSIYFAGIIFVLVKILWSNFIVFLAVANAIPDSQSVWQKITDKYCLNFWIRKPVEVRISKAVMSPVTWGFSKPVILIPKGANNWPEELIKSTVLHELAHIKRADWLVKQIVRCICSTYWFNPYIWRVFNKMMSNLETAADDMALSAGVNKTSYASDLVSVVEKMRQPFSLNFSAVGMAPVRSELGQRIEFILNPRNSHAQTTVCSFLFSVFVMFGVIVPLASFQPNFQQKIIEMDVFDDVRQENNRDGNKIQAKASASELLVLRSIDDEFFQNQKELLLREYSNILAVNNARENNISDTEKSREKIRDLPAKSVVALAVEKIKDLSESRTVGTLNESKTVVADNDDLQIAKGQVSKFSEKSSNLQLTKEPDEIDGEKLNRESALIAEGKSTTQADFVKAQNSMLASFFKGGVLGDSAMDPSVDSRQRSQSIKPLRIVKPRYPESARRRGIEGEVVVRYDVDRSGRIVNPTIIDASPKGVFDKSVIQALSRSSYSVPASESRGGKTVGQVQELYKFVLDV